MNREDWIMMSQDHELHRLRDEIKALRFRTETAEKEVAEAYAKGQIGFQASAASAINRYLMEQGYVLRAHAAAEFIRSLPIKERP